MKREYKALLVLFLAENLLLIVPLLHTCTTIIHLYSILPVLPEEQPCLTMSYIFLSSPLLLVILAGLQYVFFIKFNMSGHPWSLLLTSRRLLRLVLRVKKSSALSPADLEDRLKEVWPLQLVRGVQARKAPVREEEEEDWHFVGLDDGEQLEDWLEVQAEEWEGLGPDDWLVEVSCAPEVTYSRLEELGRAGGVELLRLVREELLSGSREPKMEGWQRGGCVCGGGRLAAEVLFDEKLL